MDKQNSARKSGLGDLGILPSELRVEIYKRLLPPSFHQTYHIVKSSFIYDARLSTAKPPCLRVSKLLRDEILPVLNLDSHHEVNIGLRTLATNFIADFKVNDTTSVLAADETTRCKLVEVTIARPSPRSVTGFAQLRSNVHDLVQLLNNSPSDILPKLTVKLDYAYAVDRGLCCGENDFSMLMGPFYRIAKQCRAVMIYRTTGSMTFSGTIEKKCNLIEESIKQSTAASDKLIYQQCNLEIKHSLILKHCEIETIISAEEKSWLLQRSNKRIIEASVALKEWYENNKSVPMPAWLPVILGMAKQKRLSDVEEKLQNEVLGEHPMDILKSWVAGHFKAYSPFWDEAVGGWMTNYGV